MRISITPPIRRSSPTVRRPPVGPPASPVFFVASYTAWSGWDPFVRADTRNPVMFSHHITQELAEDVAIVTHRTWRGRGTFTAVVGKSGNTERLPHFPPPLACGFAMIPAVALGDTVTASSRTSRPDCVEQLLRLVAPHQGFGIFRCRGCQRRRRWAPGAPPEALQWDRPPPGAVHPFGGGARSSGHRGPRSGVGRTCGPLLDGADLVEALGRDAGEPLVDRSGRRPPRSTGM